MTNKYYTLMASLPRLEKDFTSGIRIPIDRDALFFRLKELNEEDQKEMKILFSFSKKLHKPMLLTDQEVLDLYVDTHKKLKYDFLKEMILDGLTLRLALYVFRKRKMGEVSEIPVGPFPIIKHISNNTDHPDLKLASRIPYISTIRETINTGSVLEAEKIIDEHKWKVSEKMDEGEFFSFKSFISYFIKWDIIFRWSRIDSDTGVVSFENILGEVQRYEY